MDDGAFQLRRGTLGSAVIVAVLFHGSRISAARMRRIEIDGTDANAVLIALLKTMAYNVVMLSGISFAGFNLVDLKSLSDHIGKPVIAVVGERPNNTAVRLALREHFEDWKRRWRIVRNAGSLYSCRPLLKESKVYFEVKGASPRFARNLISTSSRISRLPEPIRVAGLLARGLAPLG